MHLTEIVCHKPTHLGFCNTSGLSGGIEFFEPSRYGHNLAWHHPWLPDIITELVSFKNIKGTITNSDLNLVTLIFYEATLLAAVPTARMAAPCSGLDNMPTFSLIVLEALTINLLVADLLRIYLLHSIQFFLNPSVFITQSKKLHGG